MQLKEPISKKVKTDNRLKGLLAIAFNKTTRTIELWSDPENVMHEMLTTPTALKVIREETGLTDKQILTEKVEA